MKSVRTGFYRSLLAGVVLLAGCAIPRHFLPQKDIIGSDTGAVPGQPTVLIASRDSEYKRALVAELRRQLSAANISHVTTGIEQLNRIVPDNYAAVIVISPCLAGGLDHEVNTFLDSRKTSRNIILHITSGKGSWLPEKHGRNFDAVSGASVKTDVSKIARDLMVKIKTGVTNKETQL